MPRTRESSAAIQLKQTPQGHSANTKVDRHLIRMGLRNRFLTLMTKRHTPSRPSASYASTHVMCWAEPLLGPQRRWMVSLNISITTCVDDGVERTAISNKKKIDWDTLNWLRDRKAEKTRVAFSRMVSCACASMPYTTSWIIVDTQAGSTAPTVSLPNCDK